MKKFEHGGDIAAFAESAGCGISDVIDFSSNINFIRPHISANFADSDITSYPEYHGLYAKISERYNIASENLELFNGGSTALFALMRHLRSSHKTCVLYAPLYLEYLRAAELLKYNITLVNRLDTQEFCIPENALVIFVNPATPDGTGYDIGPLLKKWRNAGCTVLVDESFLDFCELRSALYEAVNTEAVWVLKSLTKFYGAAGVRLGFLASSSANIADMRAGEPLWKISALDAAYFTEALSDEEFPARSAKANLSAEKRLSEVLENADVVEKVYPSSANFAMVKLKKGITAPRLQKKLKRFRILFRDCSNFNFLDSSFARFAVRNNADITKLKEALDA